MGLTNTVASLVGGWASNILFGSRSRGTNGRTPTSTPDLYINVTEYIDIATLKSRSGIPGTIDRVEFSTRVEMYRIFYRHGIYTSMLRLTRHWFVDEELETAECKEYLNSVYRID